MKVWIISAVSIILALCCVSSAFAQDLEHWIPGRDFVRTDNSLSIILSRATVDDEPLQIGDEVAVFTPAGLCAGAAKKAGNQLGVTAYGDDAVTEEIDGFVFDEENPEVISFKVWLRNADGELDAEVTDVVQGMEVDGQPIFNNFDQQFINVQINASLDGPPEISLPEDPIDFGEVWVNFPETMDIPITNRGPQHLIISAVESSDEAFIPVFDEEEGLLVRWTETEMLPITFDPPDEGDYEAEITIFSNTGGEENQENTVTVMGTATVPDPPNISIAEEQQHLAFRDTRVNSARYMIVQIGNTGEAPLIVEDVTFDREDDVFTSNFTEDIWIYNGQTANLRVTFRPNDVGEFTATMTIHNSDPDEGEDLFEITMVGNGAEVGDPVISLPQTEHFFPWVPVNGTASWRMMIRNDGLGDLILSDIALDAEQFTTNFDPESPASRLRPDDFLWVMVYFMPDEARYYEATLTITSNDPESEEFNVALGAIATDEEVGHFQFYPTGSNHSLLIAEVTLDDELMVEGDEVGVFTPGGLCAGGGVVDADGVCMAPAFADDFESEIIDGFQEDEAFTFRVWDSRSEREWNATPEWLEGPEVFTGEASRLTLAAMSEDIPRIRLSHIYHDFGQADYDDEQTKDWTFNITNVGPGVLTIESIESDLDEFVVSIEGEFAVDLAQNEVLPVTVTFAPLSEEVFFGRLTILSNDPVDETVYVDLRGEGVEEVTEPDISLGAMNHFYGVQHLLGEEDDAYMWTLVISNVGGDNLEIQDLELTGSDRFSCELVNPEEPFVIGVDESLDVPIAFSPVQAGNFNGSLVITSNDPTEEQQVLEVLLWGIGSAAEDHFLHYQTAQSHSIIVDNAIIITLNDQEAPLMVGDEVAVFTPEGLCAGHKIVTEEDLDQGEIGFAAYANNPDTPFEEGFNGGDAFSFKFWDWTTQDQLDVHTVEVAEGPETFQVDAATTFDLWADAIHAEPQISVVPPDQLAFGPLRINTQVTRTWRIVNSGGLPLSISRIESNLAVFTHNFNNQGQPRVLGAGLGMDLLVTFRPTQHLPYEGNLTITSTDPDEGQFVVHPTGMGSIQQGHYAFRVTGASMIIQVEEADIGGGPPAVGDEIAVFTPSGFCAGATVIDNPEQVGIGAFADDAETQILIDGFRANQAMTLRYWYAADELEFIQGAEENELVVEEVFNRLVFRANGFATVNISIPEGIPPRIAPVAAQRAEEDEQVAFSSEMIGAGELEFAFDYPENYDPPAGADDALDDNGDNTFDFVWDVPFEAIQGRGRPAQMDFNIPIVATSGDVVSRIVVAVTITDVNRAPDVANPPENDEVVVEEDVNQNGVIEVINPVRYGNNPLFVELDEDTLIIIPGNIPGGLRAQNFNPATNIYTVTIDPNDPNVNGRFPLVLIADDGRQARDRGGRQLRRTDQLDDMVPLSMGRTLRRTDSALPGVLPHRDLQTRYEFTLVITPVNDPPVITQPVNADVFQVAGDENVELVVNFFATDVDQGDDVQEWTILEDGGLPGGHNFQDNGNAGARFTWTPTFADAGQYAPVIQVSDGNADDPQTDRITVQITVRNVNRGPRLTNAVPDSVIFEDSQGNVIFDLDDVFIDDDIDDVLQFAITQDQANLGLSIDEENRLISTPVANFNVAAPGLPVSVRATDTFNASANRSFRIIVTSVNDPPSAFNLLTPADNFRFEALEDAELTFSWSEAVQNQFERDQITYTLFAVIRGQQDTVRLGPLPANIRSITLNVDDVLDTLGIDINEIDLPADSLHQVIWGVNVMDSEVTVRSTPSTRNLTIAILTVQDEFGGIIPMVHFLSPAYPNPFNAETTVRFGLPHPGEVNVTVWDMVGRRVTTLAQGRMEAGRYQTVWNAADSPSGVYIIRMQAEGFNGLQKAILLR